MIEIDTRKKTEVMDITSFIESALSESRVQSGICLIYTLHTTTAVIINEAETGLVQDILRLVATLAPEGAGYSHDGSDGNAHAHLGAVLLGNCAVVPVDEGRLVMGPWQRILFVELDGPRSRKVYVKTIPD
jgi:secondary thiamine-phosphate synthase enzyme